MPVANAVGRCAGLCTAALCVRLCTIGAGRLLDMDAKTKKGKQ